MLRTSDLDYHVPPQLIATQPVEPRDAARMMVLSRSDASRLEHRHVRDLPELLDAGDLLITNSSAVIPARIVGRRRGTGGRIEGLFIERAQAVGIAPVAAGEIPKVVHREDDDPSLGRWQMLLKGGNLKPGLEIDIEHPDGGPSGVSLRLLEPAPETHGGWVVDVFGGDHEDVPTMLARIGRIPLPPYIMKAREHAGDLVDDPRDRRWYQTVFARYSGSIAAPTAGLHFTPELLENLQHAGIQRAEVSLQVGLGTFKPVETEFIEQHPMHAEWCLTPVATWQAIKDTHAQGRHVIGVGTTTARTLQSAAAMEQSGQFAEEWIRTMALIAPGQPIKALDGLLTNFHQPRTTLMALVAALLDQPAGTGVARLQAAYAQAIEHRYRLFSFGDAMLILP